MSAPKTKALRRPRTKKSEVALVTHVPVIRVTNPFDPREFVREQLVWQAQKTLADYFPTVTATEVIVSVNGKIVPHDQFAVTYLDRTDNLVICPVPQGGGGGKNILRIVAMIAVAIVAPYAAGAMGFTAGTLGYSMAVAGITMAGSMLVNALLPPTMPSSRSNNSSSPAGSSYGIDGAKNTSVEGVPVPVVYGQFRTAGNILNLHVENAGDTQILYMLMAAGEGPIAAISDIEINDNPISDYTDVAVEVRLGENSQSIMPWFADNITSYNRNEKLTTDTWLYHTTQGPIDMFRLDVVAPNGLFGVDKNNGNEYGVAVDIECQYRLVGTANWIQMPGTSEIIAQRQCYSLDTYNGTGQVYWSGDYPGQGTPYVWVGDKYSGSYQPAPMARTWYYRDNNQQVTDPTHLDYLNRNYPYGALPFAPAILSIYGNVLRIGDQKKSAVRKSFQTPQLAPGRYEIRFRRVTPKSDDTAVSDLVYITDINEIQLDDLTYPNTGMLGLRIRLSDQLNGLPKVTYLVTGRRINVWRNINGNWQWVQEASSNPAWIVWDILTNTRFGGGMPTSRLDFQAFKRWADYCDQKGLTFNGTFETEMNVWDACQVVLRVGHAQIVGIGTRYTVVVEKADTPVMMFSVANMIEGTFKETWLSTADRANEIEVTYFDRNDKYRQRTVKVVDAAAQAAGNKQRSAAITLYGVVDYDRAYKEGLFQLNLNRYILQTVEFAAPMEAIACTVGDLIYVQHDMPQWGFAGRFEAGSTASTVKLDRPVDMEGGKQYKLLVLHDAVMRASGSVTQVTGTSVFLTGYNGVAQVKRIKVNGRDLRVAGTFNQGNGSYGVVVDDATGITPGATYELWDTDVLEERDVVNSQSTSDTLVVQTPFSAAPQQFAQWMFGEVGKIKKPFRVKTITGSHEYRRDITAVEYNESVYNLDGVAVPTPNYSSLEMGVKHVTIDSVTESLFVVGGEFKSHVTVHFSSKQETYDKAIVYASVNGGKFMRIADNAFDRATIDLSDGDIVTFRVVARDVMGGIASESTAPTKTYTVIGKTAPPADVKGFKVTPRTTDLLLTWDANTDIDLLGYEVRVGSSWDEGQVITSKFSGTMITHDQEQPGVYRYHIRAIDTGGRYSENAASYDLTLLAPSPVQAFDCVQSGNRLEFRWKANPETNIVGYEIREGLSWATSSLVAQVTATAANIPAGATGSRTFWIKAIASPGIYGEEAVFVTTDIALSKTANVVFTTDQDAAGFPGIKHYTYVYDGDLVMSDGAKLSEYVFKVDLGSQFLAQNSLFASVDAVVSDLTTWDQATFAWNSTQANRQWLADGNVTSVKVRYQIATYRGLKGNEVEGWQFDGSMISVGNRLPSVAQGVSYADGRYGKGVMVKDTTFASWSVNVPAYFAKHFWIRPQQITDCTFWSVTGAGGISLTVGYSAQKQCFYLEDHLGRRNEVPFTFGVDDRICVAVQQQPNKRSLFVGTMDGSKIEQSVTPFDSLGAFTTMRLY